MFNKEKLVTTINFLLIFLIGITFVSGAVPVQLNVNQDRGINIFYPKFTNVPQNTQFTLYLYVSNISDGQKIKNNITDCFLQLHDADGSRTFESEILGKDSNGFDHKINITVGNFTNVGIHSYYISCNTTDIGGSAHGTFTVTEGGIEITESRSILIIGLIGILVLFLFLSLYSLFNVENYIGKFILYWVSHVLMILITFTGWQVGVEGILGSIALTGIFRIIFWIFTIGTLPMIFSSIAWIVYIHTMTDEIKELINKGESPETALDITKKRRGGKSLW